MANLEKLTFVLDAKMAGLEQTINTADKKIRSFAENAERSTNAAAKSFDTMKNALLGFLTVSTAKEIIQVADSYQLLQSRIKSATDSVQGYSAASAELFAISQTTGTALENNVALFQRLKIGATELGRSDTDVLRLVESINKLGVVGGASQTEIGNASTQLSQAMAGGIVRAEEFNSIVENTPMLAKAIADGLGVSVGELRNMVLEGRLLADDVFESVLSQSTNINDKFTALGPNLGRSIQTATGALQQFIGKLDSAYGFTKAIARWLDEWSKSVQIVTEQMVRAKIYDQAEEVNKLEDQARKAREVVDEARRMVSLVTTNPQLYANLEAEESRLASINQQLKVEKERLDVLGKQELLTAGAGRRLGIDMPPVPPPKEAVIDKVPSLSGGASGSTAGPPSGPPAKKKRGASDGFQDFASQANSDAFSNIVGSLDQYRESQMSQLDIETETHTKRMSILEEYANKNMELRSYTNGVIEAEQQRHATAMEAIDAARFQGQMDVAKAGLNNLASLMNSSSRKAFEVGKIAAIAMATINGIQAVVASYKWGAEVGGPVLGAAFAATAAAATLVQIQQLKSAQFGGGGAVSAGSSGAAPGVYQPPQQTQPIGAQGEGDTGRSVNLIFNGNINGFDVAALAEQLGSYINQSDTIFIDGNSRTGLQFATAI